MERCSLRNASLPFSVFENQNLEKCSMFQCTRNVWILNYYLNVFFACKLSLHSHKINKEIKVFVYLNHYLLKTVLQKCLFILVSLRQKHFTPLAPRSMSCCTSGCQNFGEGPLFIEMLLHVPSATPLPSRTVRSRVTAYPSCRHSSC